MARPRRTDLAQAMRYLRLKAGLTGSQLAVRAGMSQSKISRIETGRILPSEFDVERLLNVLLEDPSKREQVLAVARELHTGEARRWDQEPERSLRAIQMDIADLEEQAREIRNFQPIFVPGLLQTLPYAIAALQKSNVTEHNDIGPAAAYRFERQAVARRNDLKLLFVIAQQALRSRVVSEGDLARQLEWLRVQIEAPDPSQEVALAILPDDAELPVLVNHGFVIYDGTAVAIETRTRSIVSYDGDEVAEYLRCFECLRAAACTGDRAVELITAERGVLLAR